MQSEPGWPRIILAYIRGRAVKRAPKIAIPSCGPAGPACRPEAFVVLRLQNPLCSPRIGSTGPTSTGVRVSLIRRITVLLEIVMAPDGYRTGSCAGCRDRS